MDIGEPLREIEIEPESEPLPELIPLPDLEPVEIPDRG